MFCFIGGWSADRYGPRLALTMSMLWSLFCGLTAATVGLASLLAVRIAFGMGEGPFCTNIKKLVSNSRALRLARRGITVQASRVLEYWR
ncbi:hypothetical protein QCE88_05040 [Caballeronia sp. LZ035]|nr:hypothetical protein [Caballeronia sp. LZ035]MDR5756320.1 hypothetical protein [Caballeronia sp. LZ035]